jgi:hypothetical protein
METVEWGTHKYVDLSDLNARWDQDFPGGYNPIYASPIHGLGTSNGALSGNSLGIVSRGVGQDPYYPWKEYSADTKALQEETNTALVKDGYAPIDADGVLGPATCGAVKEMIGEAPGTCQSFTEPMKISRPASKRMSLGGGNALIYGGAFALVMVGAALIVKGKKK